MKKKELVYYKINYKSWIYYVVIPCIILIALMKLFVKDSALFAFLAVGLIWVYLLVFLAFFRKYQYQQKQLNYYIKNDKVILEMDNKVIPLKDLDEVSIYETTGPLTEWTKTRTAILQIDYGEEALVFASEFLRNEETMRDVNLYQFFKEILRYNRYLRRDTLIDAKNNAEIYNRGNTNA